MQASGSGKQVGSGTRGGTLAEANDATVVARRLAREFGAPVGLFDPTRGGWRVRLGADPERFPRGDMELPAALASSGVGPGRAGVYRPDRRGGPVWLGLPVPALDGEDLVALAGFAASSEAAEADAWGPSCPEPALRAWGQAVADQLRGEKDAQAFCHGSSARPEGGERVLIARLIRRLKISDAPERFQALATGAPAGRAGRRGDGVGPGQPARAGDRQRRGPGPGRQRVSRRGPPHSARAGLHRQPAEGVARGRAAADRGRRRRHPGRHRLAGRRQPARRPPLRLSPRSRSSSRSPR